MLFALCTKQQDMVTFRFMDLDIRKEAIELNDGLFDLTGLMSDARSYKVAAQLRSASSGISNIIAEGSGSFSDKVFAHFLNVAQRSVYETSTISFVAFRRKFIDKSALNMILKDLDLPGRKSTNFRKTLLNNN